MDDVNELMSNFYDILLQIRYPNIAAVEPKDIASVIFAGENRIQLLCWLITETSAEAANVLRKLQNTALEDELVKHYSQYGICSNKDVLLGNCPLKEQIPVLKLLLEFIKNIYIYSSNFENVYEESIEYTLALHIIESLDRSLKQSNTVQNHQSLDSILNTPLRPKSEINYEEAKKYSGSVRNFQISKFPIQDSCIKKLPPNSPDKLNQNNSGHEDSFILNVKKCRNVFESVMRWPIPNKNAKENYMDVDIRNLHANYNDIKKIANITDMISSLSIPDEICQTCTPLSTDTEHVAMCMEKNV